METGKTIAITAVVIVLIIVVSGYLFYSSGQTPIVTAQGYSTLTVQPDSASVYVYIQERNLTAEDAKNQAFKIGDDVVTQLVKLGFERKDIQSGQVYINPDYSWENDRSVFKGYLASQEIIVKTKNFDKVLNIVDAAVNSGALISNMNFELSQEKENQYKIQALKLAGEDAKAKAKAIAESQGKSLGGLVDITSEDFNYRPIPYYAYSGEKGATMDVISSANAEAKVAAMNIVPKDNEVSATINVRYKISKF